jgi:preprotein translocase subunit SecF
MSIEPEEPGEEPTWSMPTPVFRSTQGRDLRAAVHLTLDAEGQEKSDKNTTMENQPKDIVEETTDPQGENAIEKEAKGDKLGASMTLVGVLALLGAAILFLLVYFMFFWGRTPSS